MARIFIARDGRPELRKFSKRISTGAMRVFGSLVLLVVMAAGLAPRAMADAERGKKLAMALCAHCHMSAGQADKQGPMGVPGFKAVANRPGQTLEAIIQWLRSVPPMMPDHKLTQDESEHLAEFILTLRDGN